MLVNQGMPKTGGPAPAAGKNFSTTFNPDGTMVASTPGASAPAFPGLPPELINALLAPSAGGGGGGGGGSAPFAERGARFGRVPQQQAEYVPSMGSTNPNARLNSRRKVLVEGPQSYMPQWAGTAPGQGRSAYYVDQDVDIQRSTPSAFMGAVDTRANHEMRQRHNKPHRFEPGGGG